MCGLTGWLSISRQSRSSTECKVGGSVADWLLHSSCFILRQDTTSNSLMCEWVNKACCIKRFECSSKKVLYKTQSIYHWNQYRVQGEARAYPSEGLSHTGLETSRRPPGDHWSVEKSVHKKRYMVMSLSDCCDRLQFALGTIQIHAIHLQAVTNCLQSGCRKCENQKPRLFSSKVKASSFQVCQWL